MTATRTDQAEPTPCLEPALAEDGPVVALLRRVLPHALAIYAFGSRVQGGADARSDLDLAVLVACPVDLLDLRRASTVMQYQVLRTGRRLWGGALAAGLYECFILSEKMALDAARAALLDDIAKEGSVYGR